MDHLGDVGPANRLQHFVPVLSIKLQVYRLRSFAESFTHGAWASVCAADYAPFFIDAVATIDTTCDEFVPEG